MAISPPVDRLWWKTPAHRAEIIWIGVAFVWGLVMFSMMIYWHAFGQQNLSNETYRTTPNAYYAKVEAMVQKYQVREFRGQPVMLLADLSRRLHSLVHEIETLAFENATNRLVNHILAQTPVTIGPATVTLHESKQALASRLTIKPETLSRTLRALTEQGLIRVDGRNIHIADVTRLRLPP